LEFGQQLRHRLELEIRAQRDARTVHTPEDTWPLVRSLAATSERLHDYVAALSSTAQYVRLELGDELLAAVGDQDAIPNSGMVVPDHDGTVIKIDKDETNSHDIDAASVSAAVIAAVLRESRDSEPAWADDDTDDTYRDRYEEWMADVLMTTITTYVGLGSFSLQVSKVREFARLLATGRDDTMSSVVSSAIRTTRKYRGVKWARQQPKPKKP
jgi:hypothetical protein